MSQIQVNPIAPVQERIIAATCIYFDISEDQLKEKNLSPDIAYRRKVCSYLMRENTNLSLRSISSRLGYRSKGTAYLHVDEIRAQVKIYKQVMNDSQNISQLALL